MITEDFLERVRTGNLHTHEGKSTTHLIFALGKLGVIRAILVRGHLGHKNRDLYDFSYTDDAQRLSYVKAFSPDTPEEVMDNYDS